MPIREIIEKYHIEESIVQWYADLVKNQLAFLNYDKLSRAEIKSITKATKIKEGKGYIRILEDIQSVTFKGKNFTIPITNPEFVTSLSDILLKRFREVHKGGGKQKKKQLAKFMFNQLTTNDKIEPYDAKIIIGLLFSLHNIALVNNPILTRDQFNAVKRHSKDNYLNYLERNIRRFLE